MTRLTPDRTDRKAAPPFVLVDAAGKHVRLSDFQGKPVVLNLWATECEYIGVVEPEDIERNISSLLAEC